MRKNDRDETNLSMGALDIVKQVLLSAGLTPILLDAAPGFVVGFEDDGPPVSGTALVYDDDWRFVFYLDFQPKVPSKNLSAVAEFITRANFGLTFGNFELDYLSGLVRFKTSVDYSHTTLLPSQVKGAILAAMDTVEFYSAALFEVIEGKKSPSQAIEDAEGLFETEE